MTEVQKIKGTVLFKDVQDKKWGLIKYRQNRETKLVRFANTSLPKTIVAGTPITAAVILQHVNGVNLPMAINVNAVKGKKKGNVMMAKSGGKKKGGTVISVDPVAMTTTILGDNGTTYIAFNVTFIPVSTAVTFKDTGVVYNGMIVATDVEID